MKVLITNDDGYLAPGLNALVREVLRAGHDVVVFAPSGERTGGAASLGMVVDGAPIDWQMASLEEFPQVPVHAIDGPPALAMKCALGEAFDLAPDIVLSGVNDGWNTGSATIHSGTLGAALTACSMGWKAAAISCSPDGGYSMDLAAAVGAAIIGPLTSLADAVALNINVPALPDRQFNGVVATRLASAALMDVGVTRDGDRLSYRIDRLAPKVAKMTDIDALAAGAVSVTALTGFLEARNEPQSDAGLVKQIQHQLAASPVVHSIQS